MLMCNINPFEGCDTSPHNLKNNGPEYINLIVNHFYQSVHNVVSQKYVDEIFAKIVKKIDLFGRLIYSAYL
jgi:hypothetical protein